MPEDTTPAMLRAHAFREDFVALVEAYADHVKRSPDTLYQLASGTSSRGLFGRIKAGDDVKISTIEVWLELIKQYPDGPPAGVLK